LACGSEAGSQYSGVISTAAAVAAVAVFDKRGELLGSWAVAGDESMLQAYRTSAAATAKRSRARSGRPI